MKYPKINTIFERDEKGKIIEGKFSEEVFGYLAGCQWVWNEKIDGMNTRIVIRHNPEYREISVQFFGRTDNAQFHPVVHDYLASICDNIRAKFPTYIRDDIPEMIIFGETCGYKIQSNIGQFYCPDGHRLIVFDVLENGQWVDHGVAGDIAHFFNLEFVPTILIGTIEDAVKKCKEGFESRVSERPMLAEGLVGVPLVRLYDKSGKRIITKIKHRDFRNEEKKD